MTVRMTFADANARATMLGTGLERGLEASYARLELMSGHEGHEVAAHASAYLYATPTKIRTEARPTATIRLNISQAEMMKAFGPAVQEVASVLSAQGIAPIGSAFAHHFRMTPGRFDFEVGFVTPTSVQQAGRVQPGQWPGGTHAHAIYFGPHEGLCMAWGEFATWMKSNAAAQAEDLY